MRSLKIGNIEDVKAYFNEEFTNKIDKYGLQAIHWASLSCNADILKWMLENKCSIESLSKNGWRPIHFAVFSGDEEMVKCLIENYCKLDCQTGKGESISDVAKGHCDREFIDEILNENNNLKVALSMRLKCGVDCDHELCRSSVMQGNFYKGENIGWGRIGKVYKVKESQTDRIFAVKIIKEYNKLLDSKYNLPNLNRYLKKLNHENIVKYFGMIETPEETSTFMEYMEKGTLEDEIKSTGSLSVDKIARYCKDILQAVAFLHRNEIIHGNIQPSQILIDNNDRCKLSLSDSRHLGNNNSKKPFSIIHPASNRVVNVTNLSSLDEMSAISASLPYSSGMNDDIRNVGKIVNRMLTGYSNRDMFKIVVKKPISNEMRKFIDDMKNARATAEQLLNYEFIRNILIDCEINNSIIDQSTKCTDLINTAKENEKIGLSMGLQCRDGCKHEFCLSSVTATNFKKGKIIGEGAGGKVYKLKFDSEVFWSMKIIKNVDDENIKKETICFENDINRYREFIDHENIVKYFGAVRNLNKIFIFMEFIDGESLYQKMKKNKYKPLPLTTIKQYTKQILEGLKFLHDKHIIHRDIKCANILINKNNIVKIADFGTSRFLRTISKLRKKSFCGTVNYMSPEVIADKPYDCSADIWSLGATVFEMATGHPPYHDFTEPAVIFKIGTLKKNKEKIEYPSNMSNDIKRFLDLMINCEPKSRSTADSLLSCEFID